MTPARTLALSTAAAALLCHGAMAQDTVVTFSTPKATAAALEEDPIPRGAPKEDYEFVGWCAGALTGHMMLFDQVEPTLKQISKRWDTEEKDAKSYAAQQIAGRDLLAEFAKAMRAAEVASATSIAPNGLRAIALGRNVWAEIPTVDANNQAYSWMNWGLPARCEKIAIKLKSRSNLMGAALRDTSANAIQTSAVRTVGERPAEPAPASPPTPVVAVAAPVTETPAAAPTPAPAPLAPAAAPPQSAAPAKSAATPARAPAPKPAATPSTTPARAAGLR